MSSDLKPRTTDTSIKLDFEEFFIRFSESFKDPNFDIERDHIKRLGEIAFKNYKNSQKAPLTQLAGEEFKDPSYKISKDWLKARAGIMKAQQIHEDIKAQTNILVIMASNRNEHTCPGEYSKTSRLTDLAIKTLRSQNVEVEFLDLSLITAEYGKTIHPCKACVSTAMPLCHWPCSCYPNYSLNQVHDWMNDIYPKWVRAHGVMIITPVYWHQAPSSLKLMIDRLVCADGGNPDPTTTQGKKAELAKEMEMKGWDYPRHLENRVFSVITHGDVVGAETLKTSLTNWLEEMSLIPAGPVAQFSRYIGYYEPYATSHMALDKDEAIHKEVQNAAIGLALATEAQRAGKLKSLKPDLKDPRPK